MLLNSNELSMVNGGGETLPKYYCDIYKEGNTDALARVTFPDEVDCFTVLGEFRKDMDTLKKDIKDITYYCSACNKKDEL